MDDIIAYDEFFVWRSVCEFLKRFGALDYGRHTEFGLNTWDCEFNVKGATSVLGFNARPRRQQLWDAWRIQLVRYENKGAKKHEGWVLKSKWEHKIDFLEKIVLFNASPYDLPMPWLREDMPKPWDVVLGGKIAAPKGAMVLGGLDALTARKTSATPSSKLASPVFP